MDKIVTKTQMQTILDNRPKGVPMDDVIKAYTSNGYKVEGINYEAPKSTLNKGIDITKGIVKGAVNTAVVEPIKFAEDIGNGILSRVDKGIESVTGVKPSLGTNNPSITAPVDKLLVPTNKDQELGDKIGTVGAIIAPFAPALISRGVKGAKGVSGLVGKGKNIVKETVDEALFTPATEEATKTTLNPFIEKVADVSIPVKNEKGLVNYVVKSAKDATPQEIQAYKEEVSDLYKNFTEQGQKFLKDRSVKGGSPVEQVGERIDHFAGEVKKFRQTVGKQMGEIEDKALNVKIAPAKNTIVQEFKNVVEQFKAGNIDNYGPDEGLNKEMKKLYKDLNNLENRGATVGETLSFTRKWARFIENQKDKFGDFKDNKFANSSIEKVVNAVKDQARDTLSESDGTYRELVSKYRLTSRFGEEAKRLLGQEGLYGSTIKGAATAKRAIQSNSDAGARQFLKTLRDITGYDGIKEADVALKAMKDVGDYQGLSLLGILSEAEGGILNTVKNVAKKLTPSEAKRTEKYIKK